MRFMAGFLLGVYVGVTLTALFTLLAIRWLFKPRKAGRVDSSSTVQPAERSWDQTVTD